jgi:hypothetical protein
MMDVLAVRRRLRGASSACRVFWVAFAGERWPAQPLTVSLGRGKEALALFSHEEEAQIFLRSLGSAGEGWRARETSAGEAVSLLYGPCCGVKSVVLDPLPQMLDDGFLGLVALDRWRFVGWATARNRSRVLAHPAS